MGIIRMGPPHELILELKQHFGIKIFIEMGTYHGNTAVWAAEHFDKVITTEMSHSIYQETSQKYHNIANIQFLFGDSRQLLKEIIPQVAEPAIFWLDSHWSGGETYGENDECPLLDELQIINQSPVEHFILIDDARYFLCPPPEPHHIAAWPTISEVVTTLGQRYIVIFEDVIIAVPVSATDFVARYHQKRSTEDWLAFGKRQNQNRLAYGFQKMIEGIEIMAGYIYKILKNRVATLVKTL
ncbi:MAG: hypothetical protein OHK0046_13990 [Anaerolineae bacterium]